MKRIVSVFVMFLTLSAIGQIKNAPTTIEEYNYMKSGYKEQVEKGLDIKKVGYKVDDFLITSDDMYNYDIKKLVRISDNSCAGLIFVAEKKESSKKKRVYIAMPVNNQEMVKKYFWESCHETSLALFSRIDWILRDYFLSNYFKV